MPKFRAIAFAPFYHLKSADISILVICGVLVLFGLVMVYSSSYIYALERMGDGYHFIRKQLIFCVLGVFALVVGSKISPRFWLKGGYLFLGLSALLLVMVLIPGFGVKLGGAQRWLSLGFISFQPAEVVKLAAVIFTARQLTIKKDELHRFGPGVLSCFLSLIPLMILLLLQPDFGSMAMIILVTLGMMFVGGVSWKNIFITLALGGIAFATLILTSPYRLNRLTVFMNPWADPSGSGFQILQSLAGLSNGQLMGVGLGNGKSKLFFLPEAHNDFIFAVIGEELGFVGVCAVVLCFLFLLYRGFALAFKKLQSNNERYAGLLCFGITFLIGLQAFVNMGVVVGTLPTKGLNLPLVSYGGTALLLNLFAIGILLRVSKNEKNKI